MLTQKLTIGLHAKAVKSNPHPHNLFTYTVIYFSHLFTLQVTKFQIISCKNFVYAFDSTT